MSFDIITDRWKVPHIIKIPEAYSAIADFRFKIENEFVRVFSSDYTKVYTVEIFPDGYASNDNMSFNNGILGYPIVVAMMISGKLGYNKEIVNLFAGVNWTKLNIECNKDFSLSYSTILKKFIACGIDVTVVRENVDIVYEELKNIIPSISRKKGNFTFCDSIIV